MFSKLKIKTTKKLKNQKSKFKTTNQKSKPLKEIKNQNLKIKTTNQKSKPVLIKVSRKSQRIFL
jgi:hypothetical protein